MKTTAVLVKPQYMKVPEGDFFAELKKMVTTFANDNSKYVYLLSGIKAILLFIIYLALYTGILLKGNNPIWLFLCYAVMAVVTMMIFLNIVHPAAHNALFRSKKLNSVCQYAFEIFGTSSYLWRAKHIRLHHPYSNIPTWDCDIEQTDLIKIFPDSKFYGFHRYQHLYAPVLYLFYTLNWLFVRDFRDFFQKNRIVRKAVKIPAIEFYKLFLTKICYVMSMIVIPYLLLDVSLLWVLGGFILMHIIASAIGMIALVSTHAGETATWTYPAINGDVEQTWAYHQMISANDFSTANPVANLAFGHLNHHVAHHLFPSLNPELYIGVTKIVKDFSIHNQLPYRCFTIRQTMLSHYNLLRSNAFNVNLLDEDM